MKDFFKFRTSMNEATFASSNIKMSGQNDCAIKELSMKKKWKAGVQRALVGPSTKKKPLMFRTMGKDAKEMQKKADALKAVQIAVRDQDKNRLNIAKHVVNKMRKEEVDLKEITMKNFFELRESLLGNNVPLFGKNLSKPSLSNITKRQTQRKHIKKTQSAYDKHKDVLGKHGFKRPTVEMTAHVQEDISFKVTIDGLPDIYMDAKTPGELKAKLRKIVKQPSLIQDIERITKEKKKKAFRDKAQGREDVEEATSLGDYGTPESVRFMKKFTPGQREEKDSRIKSAGVSGFNKPKGTPSHPKKSHIVVAKSGDKIKTIRFGEQGASTAGAPKAGESDKMKAKRKSFKARHGKNIAKGKMSAAYWSDKEKW